MKRLPLFLLFILFLAACDSESLQNHDVSMVADSAVQIGGYTNEDLRGDLFALNSARFEGQFLEMSVSFSGGCNEHDYSFFVSETVLLSDPPQLSMFVVHDDRDDFCDAYLTETISTDMGVLIDWVGGGPFLVSLVVLGSDTQSIDVTYGG